MASAIETYYDTLGITNEATQDDIKKAYKKKALQWHPDRNKGSEEAENKFKEVSLAYQILSDPIKRKTYDLTGSLEDTNFDFNGSMDIFNEIFQSQMTSLFGENSYETDINSFGESLEMYGRRVYNMEFLPNLSSPEKMSKLDKLYNN